MTENNRYNKIIEKIFFSHYKRGRSEITFQRDELSKAASELSVILPKNLGDLIYSFRYRVALPETIKAKAPKSKVWIIRPVGRSMYQFALVNEISIVPNKNMTTTKIADATPGIVEKYALNDEQGLLAKLRYNRMIDIFTGVTCYSLQNHLRTTVPNMGQVETDELYVGVDSRGAQYVFPIQAKGGTDKLNIVQIEQDFALCKSKFGNLICRPIAAQFIKDNVIALFSFEETESGLRIATEKHYKLVPPDDISPEELEIYKNREE